MEVNTYAGLKYVKGEFSKVDDILTVEEAIQISINDDPYTVTMRTPGKDRELVRGLLFSEDIYKRTDEPFRMSAMDINERGEVTAVNVVIEPKDLGKGYIPTRNILSVSSCGICGKRELDDIAVEGEALENAHQLDPSLIKDMLGQMRQKQTAFDQSGGCHAAAAFTIEGQLLNIQEDIGRHNAVDKVIGSLVLNDQLQEAKCLLVSGRISYEIVTKAFVAGFPYLASVSAPSTLSVDYAEQLGITLLSFCRDDKATCYANKQGIKQ
jgi:FdhD protein